MSIFIHIVYGQDFTLFSFVGIIALIGVVVNNGIVLVDWINRLVRVERMDVREACLSAAKSKLRPILMTILAMIFGLLPLMFASGAGANGNSSLGSGVIGGMLFGTLGILFLVPVFFIIFQYMQEKVKPVEFLPHPDWQIESEMDAIEQRKKDK